MSESYREQCLRHKYEPIPEEVGTRPASKHKVPKKADHRHEYANCLMGVGDSKMTKCDSNTELSGRVIKALQEFTSGAKKFNMTNTFWLYDGHIIATDTYHIVVMDMPKGWVDLLEKGHVYKPESDVVMKVLVSDTFKLHRADTGELLMSRVPAKGDPYSVSVQDITQRAEKAAAQTLGWAAGEGKPKADAVPSVIGLDPRFVSHVCGLAEAVSAPTVSFDTFFDGSAPLVRVTFPGHDGMACVIAPKVG